VTFRPGAELGQIVSTFATDRGLAVTEAYRDLAALAVVGLDARYHQLLARMAVGMGGRNAFARAAVHVHTSFLGAMRVGADLLAEPARTIFLIDTVRAFVTSRGQLLPPEVTDLLLSRIGVQPAPVLPDIVRTPPERPVGRPEMRRRIRTLLPDDDAPANAPPVAAEPDQSTDWQSTGNDRGEVEQQQLEQ
jgi:hypothetical protein